MYETKNIGTIFLCLGIMLGSVICGFSQTIWNRIYGGDSWDWPYQVLQLPDNGYAIAGWSDSFNSWHYSDGWLLRTNALGDTLWTKLYGGYWPDEIYALAATTDGGFLLAGMNSSFDGGVWLIRTDSSGDTLWTTDFGGTINGDAFSVHTTPDSNYIVAGRIWNFTATEYDAWIMKVNQAGDSIWFRRYGGMNDDAAHGVLPTPDGGYIAVCGTESFGAGDSDGWLIRTDSNGDTLLTKTYGGSDYENLLSIRQTTDGGYIMAGSTYSFDAGNGDGWLVKTDSSGDTTWTKTYGGVESEGFSSVWQTIDGGYIMTGTTRSYGAGWYDIWLVRTDEAGDTLWTKTFGGKGGDYGNSVQQTSDGGYIIAARAVFDDPSGSPDLWLVKTDAMGNTLTGINLSDLKITNGFRLFQNYPNPFNPETNIRYRIPEAANIQLEVYNLLGEKIITLVNEYQSPGEKIVRWNGKDALGREASSGVYIYHLTAGDFSESRKIVLLR